MSKTIKIFMMSLMMTFIFLFSLNADSLYPQNPSEYAQVAQLSYQQQLQPQVNNQASTELSASDRAVGILLDHGITGLVLLILGWWYYKRQQQWDEESASMRKELLEYVKADQASDYEMMAKIGDMKEEIKREIHSLKEEMFMRTFERRKVPRDE
jgi:hypothetical protein